MACCVPYVRTYCAAARVPRIAVRTYVRTSVSGRCAPCTGAGRDALAIAEKKDEEEEEAGGRGGGRGRRRETADEGKARARVSRNAQSHLPCYF